MRTKNETKDEYLRRINIVVEYINDNLAEKLDLNKLAGISMLSPYHFHRIVSAFLGEPIGAYITRVRVEKAARLLRHTTLTVEEIAFSVGYEMTSSLSKAFRQFYDITPSEYRNNKKHYIMKPIEIKSDLKLKKPRVKEFEPKHAIYIRLTGPYDQIDYGGTWQRLWTVVKDEKLFSAGIEHIAIYHDDPKVTDVAKLRTDVCLVVRKPAKPKGEIGVKEIAGGKYAVFAYQGPYEDMRAVYDAIYSRWLPESGYELRDVPNYEKYINNPGNTPLEKLKTEIYVPVK